MTIEKQNRLWELATAKLHNEASETELKELSKLLKDEENKKLFRKIEQLKSDTASLVFLNSISQEKSRENLRASIQNKTLQMFWTISKYAAIIALAFFIGILINKGKEDIEFTGLAEVKVPLGQMSEITLYDGTRVWMNSGTSLKYNSSFGLEERNVFLSGEAFFDVSKNEMPFKVIFKGKEVKVLGTKFNVIAYNDESLSTVTLLEGKVDINKQSGSKIASLKPAEQIIIDEASNIGTISTVETNFYVSWTDGKIVFEEEKLSDISKKLERWYNVDIQFNNESIKELKFSGTILKNKPFDQIMSAFELLLPVKIKYTHVLGEKDVVLISKK